MSHPRGGSGPHTPTLAVSKFVHPPRRAICCAPAVLDAASSARSALAGSPVRPWCSSTAPSACSTITGSPAVLAASAHVAAPSACWTSAGSPAALVSAGSPASLSLASSPAAVASADPSAAPALADSPATLDAITYGGGIRVVEHKRFQTTGVKSGSRDSSTHATAAARYTPPLVCSISASPAGMSAATAGDAPPPACSATAGSPPAAVVRDAPPPASSATAGSGACCRCARRAASGQLACSAASAYCRCHTVAAPLRENPLALHG